MTISFNTDRIEEMAKFIANLVREGVTWETRESSNGWVVTLTGGF